LNYFSTRIITAVRATMMMAMISNRLFHRSGKGEGSQGIGDPLKREILSQPPALVPPSELACSILTLSLCRRSPAMLPMGQVPPLHPLASTEGKARAERFAVEGGGEQIPRDGDSRN
jgi:hypothetical protein